MTGGGIKGAAAAARYHGSDDVTILHIDYGQLAARAEADAAAKIATGLGGARFVSLALPHVAQVQQIPPLRSAGASVSHRDEDTGHVLSPPTLRGLLPVLVATGVQLAFRIGATKLALGMSRWGAISHLGFPTFQTRPDALREWLHAMGVMTYTLSPSQGSFTIEAPFVDSEYADIVRLAMSFDLPLQHTWTCELRLDRPCGKCSNCEARAVAFDEARVPDPLLHPATAVAVGKK